MSDSRTAAQNKIVGIDKARYAVYYRYFMGNTELYATKEDAEARSKELTIQHLVMRVESAVVLAPKQVTY